MKRWLVARYPSHVVYDEAGELAFINCGGPRTPVPLGDVRAKTRGAAISAAVEKWPGKLTADNIVIVEAPYDFAAADAAQDAEQDHAERMPHSEPEPPL